MSIGNRGFVDFLRQFCEHDFSLTQHATAYSFACQVSAHPKHLCRQMRRLSVRHIGSLTLFKWQEDSSPQLAGLAHSVGQLDVCHAGILVAAHGFQLRDNIVQRDRFADCLRSRWVEIDVDDVDMKVVVCWLV